MLLQRWSPDSGLRSELVPFNTPIIPTVWPPQRSTMGPTTQENASEVVVSVPVPGLEPETLRLELLGDVLKLSVEHEEGANGQSVQRRFEQTIPLPCAVQAEGATAEARHGVLIVKVPKHASAIPSAIPITTS